MQSQLNNLFSSITGFKDPVIFSTIIDIFKSLPWAKIYLIILAVTAMFIIRFLFKGLLIKSITRALGRYYKSDDELSEHVPTIYIVDKIVFYAIIVGFVLIVSQIIGVRITELTIVIGALSGFVAFGLQGFIKHFVSGVLILLEGNIRVGDVLDITALKVKPKNSSPFAWVTEIKSRTSILTTFDGRELIIPNSDLIEEGIVNITLSSAYRRVHVPFPLPSGIDFDNIKDKIVNALNENPICLKQPASPTVWLMEVKLGYIRCECVVWINQKRIKTSPVSVISNVLYKVLREEDCLLDNNSMMFSLLNNEDTSA